MPRSSARRRFAAAIGTSVVAVVATLTVAVAPAEAAPSGYILTKGTGSTYTTNQIINLGIVPGSTAKTFYYKVVNTSSTPENFKLTLSKLSLNAFSATLYKGYSAVPDVYVTPAIAAGRSLSLKIKVSVPAGSPQGEYIARLTLSNPANDAFIDDAYGDANATNQTGTKRNDLFLKTGSQPYVGGSVPQFETANAIRVGGSATYTVRLKNDGGAPAAIGLHGASPDGCGSNFSVTVKQGTKNVTAAVVAGTYNTGTLTPGSKVDLRVSIKLLSAPTCTATYVGFTSSGPDGNVTQFAHVVVGV